MTNNFKITISITSYSRILPEGGQADHQPSDEARSRQPEESSCVSDTFPKKGRCMDYNSRTPFFYFLPSNTYIKYLLRKLKTTLPQANQKKFLCSRGV